MNDLLLIMGWFVARRRDLNQGDLDVNPLPIMLTWVPFNIPIRMQAKVNSLPTMTGVITLITWSWEGLVCGLNIITGLTSCGLMNEFTSCGLITATI